MLILWFVSHEKVQMSLHLLANFSFFFFYFIWAVQFLKQRK